jgi:ferredoxin-NADP reductase/DMSO/TMAO reductase YedYZ heme-binding membrane subunit
MTTLTTTPRIKPPRTTLASDMPFARLGLIINAAVPAALLLWDALHHQLGADPVNFAIHTTGFIALLSLLLSLTVTPLRSIPGFSWLLQFRRSLGLYAFFYASCHLAIYFWYDRAHDLGSTVHEITHRLYLVIGFTALLLMAPLAATSFNAAVRALGGKNWKRLHRLVYLSAILGCIHFYMQGKVPARLSLVMIAALSLLLGYRLLLFIKHKANPAMRTPATSLPAKLRFWKGNLKLASMIDETPTVRTFRLIPENNAEIPFQFAAGQFLNLTLTIDGKPVRRSYTIASPPTRTNYIELTIKREPNGQASSFLHQKLMTGHSVEISAPAGRFTFNPNSQNKILLLAGGVGITPVMAILRDLTDKNWPGQIDLLFSVKTPDEIIFNNELQSLAQKHKNLHLHITITRDAPATWTGPRGRISNDLLQQLVPDFTTRPTFICGPTEMATAVKSQLLSAGTPESRIKLESFTPAAAVQSDNGAAPESEIPSDNLPTVTFAQSNKSAPLPPKKSLLDLAESLHIPIDYDCRSGICGRCRTKLLAGQVTMPVNDALTDADLAEGYILACQAHCKDPITLDA